MGVAGLVQWRMVWLPGVVAEAALNTSSHPAVPLHHCVTHWFPGRISARS
jgi:hypothetical protein